MVVRSFPMVVLCVFPMVVRSFPMAVLCLLPMLAPRIFPMLSPLIFPMALPSQRLLRCGILFRAAVSGAAADMLLAKRTKMPILCSGRWEGGIGKRKSGLPANHRARFKNLNAS